MSRRPKWIGLAALALGLTMLPACGAGSDNTAAAGAPAHAATGASAVTEAAGPTLTVVDLDGLRQALQDHRGQPLLLNLWAMWCGPCVAELPNLQGVQEQMVAAGGAVLGLNCELMAPGRDLPETLADLPAFLAERGLTFPHLVYEDEDFGPLADELDVALALPVTLAIGADGEIKARHKGVASADEFAELAAAACGSPR